MRERMYVVLLKTDTSSEASDPDLVDVERSEINTDGRFIRTNWATIDDAFGGGLLLVSQFTLAADTRKGLRPSFTTAAPPELGRQLFVRVVEYAHAALPGKVATGRFGAEMKVSLVNDGPVTFWLRFSAGAANESR